MLSNILLSRLSTYIDEIIGDHIQQAFGDDAMGATQIKDWFNRFKDGRTLADSDQHSGRP
jgi:hypothetical protein